ncbi:MAG: metal ABC transporter substrate-binding protein [Clostridiales bacterium]|nr:metal ABC transporter substrate-binding protein [Clostridiales bacterium]
MKKRILALLLAAAVALPLCACAPAGEEAEDGRLQVVCSLFPYYDFVREIGGAYVSPRLLVAAGREAHSFEPTPMDVIRVSRADVFVYNGGEGEQWVDEILSSAGENIPTVLRMMDYADTLTEEPLAGRDDHDHADHNHEHDDDHDSDDIEYDEHIWTSPVQAMKLCRAICDALCAADPAHAAVYRSNLENYLGQLAELDVAFRQVCSEKKRSLLVFGDRFPLLYFCREYGLDYRAAFHGCSSDTEPSLYTLKFLIDKVRQQDIPVVYALELSSRKVADAIAETTGATVETFYSCQTVSQADWAAGEGYVSLMRRNVAALREGIC